MRGWFGVIARVSPPQVRKNRILARKLRENLNRNSILKPVIGSCQLCVS